MAAKFDPRDVARIIYERHAPDSAESWWALPAYKQDRWLETAQIVFDAIPPATIAGKPDWDSIEAELEDVQMDVRRLEREIENARESR